MPVLPEWHGNWHVYNDMRCSQVKEGDSVLYFQVGGATRWRRPQGSNMWCCTTPTSSAKRNDSSTSTVKHFKALLWRGH